MAKHRSFTDQFKAKVALRALCGDKTVKKIAAKHQLNLLLALEFPLFDGHFFTDEGECFSCRERGTRTRRNFGSSWWRWRELVAVLKVLRETMSLALPRSMIGSSRLGPMVANVMTP